MFDTARQSVMGPAQLGHLAMSSLGGLPGPNATVATKTGGGGSGRTSSGRFSKVRTNQPGTPRRGVRHHDLARVRSCTPNGPAC